MYGLMQTKSYDRLQILNRRLDKLNAIYPKLSRKRLDKFYELKGKTEGEAVRLFQSIRLVVEGTDC